MFDVAALRAANDRRWEAAKLTRGPEFERPATKSVANKESYREIERRTGVHWCFVAVTHYRESSQDFSKSLAQGDPWDRISTHVPIGRGPFRSFEDAAVDALANCAPYAARNKDWSISNMLTLLERYNGLGYARRGIPSPYIWSGTDQYTRGKYVRDGVFDPNVVDKQLGCAGLILAIKRIDPSLSFDAGAVSPIRDGTWLQESLNRLGASPMLNVDGIIGPGTRAAVRAFQASLNLTVDGLVGPITAAAIDDALKSAA